MVVDTIDCPECKGTGEIDSIIWWRYCENCGGNGYVTVIGIDEN